MRRLCSSFALVAVLLLSIVASVKAEKITTDLTGVNVNGSVYVNSNKDYVTFTVTQMPTSSTPGLLAITKFGNKNAGAGTSVSGDIYIPAIITDNSNRRFIINKINDEVFKDCNKLTSVYLIYETTTNDASFSSFSSYKGKLVIGTRAFSGCTSLTRLYLRTSKCPFSVGVYSVFNYAFDNCTSLTAWDHNLAEGYNVGAYAFNNCSSLLSLYAGGTTEETAYTGCTKVRVLYWYGCSSGYNEQLSVKPFEPFRTKVTSVTLYGAVPIELFKNFTNLKKVYTPADVFDKLSNTTTTGMGIGKDAFYGCSNLETIEVAGFIHHGAFIFCPKVTSITYRGGFYNFSSEPTVSYESFFTQIASTITSFKIESTSTNNVPSKFLPNYICSDMVNLKSVTIPNYVTYVGDGAFLDCTSLQSVTLPSSIKYIYTEAFAGCTALTTCPIGASHTNLKTIGKEAFRRTGLTSFYVPESVTSMGGLLLDQSSNVKEILFNTRNVTRSAVGGSYAKLFFSTDLCRKAVEKFYINPDMTVIPDSLLYNFSGLQRLADKNGLTELSSIKYINKAAFYGCTSLWDAYGPNKFPNLTEVEESAFEASNFAGFELPALKTIGKRAFANTKLMYLHDLGAMANLISIGEEAFADNEKLSSATFAGVQTIGEKAFANNSKLETINISQVIPSIQSNSFEGCNVKAIKGTCTIIDQLSANNDWKAVCSNISAADNNYKYPTQMDNFWCEHSTMEIVEELNCEGIFVVKAVPDEGCTFLYWNDGSTENPRTINLNEYTDSWLYSKAVSEADFHTTNFGVQPEGAGYLEITNQFGHDRNNQKFPLGEQAKLTPKELNGWYEFNKWEYLHDYMMEEPSICDLEYAPTTLCVSINYTYDAGGDIGGEFMGEPVLRPMFDENLYAQFTLKANPVTVELCYDENGTVDIESVYQTVGNTVTIEAIPNEGYEFAQWSDGNEEATRQLTITPELLTELVPMGADPETGDMTFNEQPVDMGDGSIENYHSESTYVLRLCAQFRLQGTGINDIQNDRVQTKKIMRDGVIYIMRGDKVYNVLGAEVK